MNEVGRVCFKIAGRDSNKVCVIVDIESNGFVLIDGQTRRRKCNPLHLEPLGKKIDIKKGASHEEVKKALEKLGYEVLETKPKKAAEKPKKQRTVKEKAEVKPKKADKKPKAEKKPAKKESPAEETSDLEN